MSTQFVWSAQDVCATRLCAAQGCPDEASGSGIALCARHDKEHSAGHTIPLHVIPQPKPETLTCSDCRQAKPDTDFYFVYSRAASKRRGRHYYCKTCTAARGRKRNARKGGASSASFSGRTDPTGSDS